MCPPTSSLILQILNTHNLKYLAICLFGLCAMRNRNCLQLWARDCAQRVWLGRPFLAAPMRKGRQWGLLGCWRGAAYDRKGPSILAADGAVEYMPLSGRHYLVSAMHNNHCAGRRATCLEATVAPTVCGAMACARGGAHFVPDASHSAQACHNATSTPVI